MPRYLLGSWLRKAGEFLYTQAWAVMTPRAVMCRTPAVPFLVILEYTSAVLLTMSSRMPESIPSQQQESQGLGCQMRLEGLLFGHVDIAALVRGRDATNTRLVCTAMSGRHAKISKDGYYEAGRSFFYLRSWATAYKADVAPVKCLLF